MILFCKVIVKINFIRIKIVLRGKKVKLKSGIIREININYYFYFILGLIFLK